MVINYHCVKRTASDGYLNSLIKDTKLSSKITFSRNPHITKTFLANGVSSPEVHGFIARNLIALTADTLDGKKAASQNFYWVLTELRSKKIPVHDLLHVHTVLARLGYFHLAKECRLLAKNTALLNYEIYGSRAPANFALEAFYAFLDQGNLAAAAKIILERPWLCEVVPNLSPWLMILRRLGYLAHEEPYLQECKKRNAAFADYIKGKNVALVGVSGRSSKNGEEIDNADIVIRMNCMHSLSKEEQKSQGSRTNVVYCRSKLFRKYVPNNFSEFEKYREANFIVSTEPAFSDGVEYGLFPPDLADEPSGQNLRSTLAINGYPSNVGLFNGHLNFGPRVVLDLFANNAASVSIYNMDFRTTKNYMNGYSPIGENNTQTLSRIMRDISCNDQFSAFKFIQMFSSKGFVSGSKEFLNLLQMRDEGFYSLLEGAWQGVRTDILRYEFERRNYWNKARSRIFPSQK